MIGLLALLLAAPAIDRTDPSTWPADLDAVVAAPANHKVVVDNDRVRVLEVIVPPGTTEPVHAHRWPSVVRVEAGEHFIDRDETGRILFDSRTLGAPLKLPVTQYAPPEAPHAIENLSKTVAMRLIRVELKQP